MSTISTSTLLYVAAQPSRQQIIQVLREQGPLALKDIAHRLKLPEEIAGFHLVALEQHGLVSGSFQLATSQARAVRFFAVTDKVKEAMEACERLV